MNVLKKRIIRPKIIMTVFFILVSVPLVAQQSNVNVQVTTTPQTGLAACGSSASQGLNEQLQKIQTIGSSLSGSNGVIVQQGDLASAVQQARTCLSSVKILGSKEYLSVQGYSCYSCNRPGVVNPQNNPVCSACSATYSSCFDALNSIKRLGDKLYLAQEQIYAALKQYFPGGYTYSKELLSVPVNTSGTIVIEVPTFVLRKSTGEEVTGDELASYATTLASEASAALSKQMGSMIGENIKACLTTAIPAGIAVLVASTALYVGRTAWQGLIKKIFGAAKSALPEDAKNLRAGLDSAEKEAAGLFDTIMSPLRKAMGITDPLQAPAEQKPATATEPVAPEKSNLAVDEGVPSSELEVQAGGLDLVVKPEPGKTQSIDVATQTPPETSSIAVGPDEPIGYQPIETVPLVEGAPVPTMTQAEYEASLL